ncbi:glycogen synthase GlgA [Pseudacidobacterium ailaaui]|jgi:starch synthase|uniref:glycogen synthase GlgA n=1 Tax=Pseudacidobacterium ailaaui TaxID=1382359 RepID=UPI00047E6950|nr:glycogen synthase GlgA [Pseudacidobacterium ailaaui]MBX6360455.1 glycogen synthase GlgA [Pseudacidobacterium ailaaui]MCL6463760.1 glycogen synthase GlgA [Pseudacidobacterium ailaaui]
MHIVFAASECLPFIKTGGLADVIGSLPREIARKGHQVTVYLPFYRQVREHFPEKKIALPSLTIPFQYYNRFAAVVDGGKRDGVQYFFIDCPELFDRESPYATPAGDYPDNWERFGLFCRAVLEASKQLGIPDIFHVHDWQTSLLPVYLRTVYYFDPLLRNVGTVLTIHNAGYHGLFPPVTVERLLLPWDIFTPEKVEFYDSFNFLKGGIVYADMLTTVSHKYAEEIQTPEFGHGLEGVLHKRASDLRGILNGVDYSKWDPATDGRIAAHYSIEDLEGKAECKRDLLHAFGAPHLSEDTAVLGIVSRLATQKGFDLTAQIIERLTFENIFLVVLGTGEPYYENLFRSLHERFPEKISVRITYDETLAHKIEAGADIYLMPSRYEPCGLNQIYSLKYGTVPVVRATGGLDDTIEEWDPQTHTGTGFKFANYAADDYLQAVQRALTVFKDKTAWRTLMRNGMKQDYSWAKPSSEYIEVYQEVARRRS